MVVDHLWRDRAKGIWEGGLTVAGRIHKIQFHFFQKLISDLQPVSGMSGSLGAFWLAHYSWRLGTRVRGKEGDMGEDDHN